MKEWFYFAIMFALILIACSSNSVPASPTQLHVPTATSDATPTPIATITATIVLATAQNEGQAIVEVVEENRGDINEYQAKIFWGINKDKSEYWAQIGVTNEQSLMEYLKQNDWTIPASDNKNVRLLYFANEGHTTYRLAQSLVMDKPLSLAPQFVFLTPDTDIAFVPLSGMAEYNFIPGSKDPGDIAASIGTKIETSDEINTIKHILYWKNADYDLRSNDFNGDVNMIRIQANQIMEAFLLYQFSYANFEDGTISKIVDESDNWAYYVNGRMEYAVFSSFLNGLNKHADKISSSEAPPQIFR